MRILAVLFLPFLLALPGAAQDLERVLAQAREEAAQARAEAEKGSRERARLREELLARLLRLEEEERRLSGTLEELRTRQAEASRAAGRAEQERRELEAAAAELLTLLRQGARALLARTEGSLAALGGLPFAAARQGLAARLARAEGAEPGPWEELLAATLELGLAEVAAGAEVASIQVDLPDREGRLRPGPLFRVGLLGAAGPPGVAIPRGTGEEWRLARPGFFSSHRAVDRALESLASPPPAALPFPLDVTGGLGLAALAGEKGWRQTLEAGGPILVPILLAGAVGLLLALWRSLALIGERRRLRGLGRALPPLVARGARAEAAGLCRRRGGAVGRTLAAGLAAAGRDRDTAERILDQAILQGSLALERALGTLGVLGTLAPFLGLLGTVTGMISTFSALTASAGRDSSVLAGGIAEALITTEAGLAVAIPLVLLHSVLSGQAERLGADLEEAVLGLSGRPGGEA